MKAWNELSYHEKRIMFNKELSSTLEAITEAPNIVPKLTTFIEKAACIAEDNQTPWFFTSILLHDCNCKLTIYKIVVTILHAAKYRSVLDPIVMTL